MTDANVAAAAQRRETQLAAADRRSVDVIAAGAKALDERIWRIRTMLNTHKSDIRGRSRIDDVAWLVSTCNRHLAVAEALLEKSIKKEGPDGQTQSVQ